MKKKIAIIFFIIIIIVSLALGCYFIVINQNLKSNDTYHKTEFEIEFISQKYIIKLPNQLALENTSGNIVYNFKTLKTRKKLKQEIENLYSTAYKDIDKVDSEGYKLYYDENQNLTIGYRIDSLGLTDLYLVVYEGLK